MEKGVDSENIAQNRKIQKHHNHEKWNTYRGYLRLREAWVRHGGGWSTWDEEQEEEDADDEGAWIGEFIASITVIDQHSPMLWARTTQKWI